MTANKQYRHHPARFWQYLNKEWHSNIIRSKGVFWIASRPNDALNWSQAGGSLRADKAGIISISNVVRAQDCNLRLSGHVEDTDTRDKLTDATVTIVELNRQMMTDSTGDFAFDSLCTGNYTIRISHVHCETKEQKVQLNKKKHLDFFLPHSKNTLTEVIVEARKEISNTGFKKELSGKALQETKELSLSEALCKINGVTMLQTGSTIAKPVIHGLHSNRILTINGLIEYKIIGLHIECNDQKKATFICLHCGQFNAITIKEEFLEIPKKISIEKVIFEGFCEQCSSDF